jgi:hypothetical protein
MAFTYQPGAAISRLIGQFFPTQDDVDLHVFPSPELSLFCQQ